MSFLYGVIITIGVVLVLFSFDVQMEWPGAFGIGILAHVAGRVVAALERMTELR